MVEFLIKEAALSVGTAWFLSQVVLKLITFSLRKNKVMWNAVFISGGMPSAHTALVTSISTAIGLSQGFNSPLFLVCVVFAFIVIHDVLFRKRVIEGFLKALAEKNPRKDLLEQLGHSLMEVLAGAVIGIGTVALFYIY